MIVFSIGDYFVEREHEDGSVTVTPNGELFSWRIQNKRFGTTEAYGLNLSDAVNACVTLAEEVGTLMDAYPSNFNENTIN